jgi:ATP adenylyltransferase
MNIPGSSAMKRLWSPWRASHVEAAPPKTEAQSIFSKLAAEHDDERNLILYRGQHLFVILNLFPYNNGHLLVVPYREVPEFTALTADEQSEMIHLVDRCLRWLQEALHPDGFNVGMNLGPAGGAGIPKHVHMHVVPRWSADTNFMAVTSETKIIPESLEDTYRKLRKIVVDTGDHR